MFQRRSPKLEESEGSVSISQYQSVASPLKGETSGPKILGHLSVTQN